MPNELLCSQCGRPLQARGAPGTRILCPGCGAFTPVPDAPVAPPVPAGAPIEFRCTGCDKLLRTPANTAGKQAKCPDCGAVMTVPAAGEGPTDSGSVLPPLRAPGPAVGSPFAPLGPQPIGYDPENPYTSPTQYTPAPASYGAPIAGTVHPTVIDVGDVIGRTWTIFKEQWGMCLVVALLVWAISVAVNMLVGAGVEAVGAVVRDEAVIVTCTIAGNVVTSLFRLWIGIGQSLYFLKVARGRKAELGDLFSGGPYLVPVLCAGILWVLVYFFGLILLIVPGVILALMFSQFYWLILDQRMGIIDSLSISKEITNGNKLSLLLLWLVSAGIGILGFLACCVGIFPAMAFVALLGAVKYLVMTGQPTADQFMYPTRPVASDVT